MMPPPVEFCQERRPNATMRVDACRESDSAFAVSTRWAGNRSNARASGDACAFCLLVPGCPVWSSAARFGKHGELLPVGADGRGPVKRPRRAAPVNDVRLFLSMHRCRVARYSSSRRYGPTVYPLSPSNIARSTTNLPQRPYDLSAQARRAIRGILLVAGFGADPPGPALSQYPETGWPPAPTVARPLLDHDGRGGRVRRAISRSGGALAGRTPQPDITVIVPAANRHRLAPRADTTGDNRYDDLLSQRSLRAAGQASRTCARWIRERGRPNDTRRHGTKSWDRSPPTRPRLDFLR